MNINPLFSDEDVLKLLVTFQQNFALALDEILKEAGEEFVKLAKDDNGSYKDDTGNLRSSIGYAIIKDNEVEFVSSFTTVKNGEAGSIHGKQLVSDIVKTLPRGVILVGVAGMTYAAAVEAKGFEVISSSSLQAESWLKQSIQTILNKV